MTSRARGEELVRVWDVREGWYAWHGVGGGMNGHVFVLRIESIVNG